MSKMHHFTIENRKLKEIAEKEHLYENLKLIIINHTLSHTQTSNKQATTHLRTHLYYKNSY